MLVYVYFKAIDEEVSTVDPLIFALEGSLIFSPSEVAKISTRNFWTLGS